MELDEVQQDSEKRFGGSQINVLSRYVAPWALPREEIPIHLTWDPSFEYDEIEIQMPTDVEIKEFLNVDSHEERGSNVLISRLKTPDFFGLVVAANGMLEKQHETRQITVNFMSGGKQRYSHKFELNLYRPMLFAEAEARIVLKDNSNPYDLINVKLIVSGFGRIEVTTELSEGGEFVPLVEPLFQEMARRVVTAFRLDESPSEEKKEIKINATYLERTAKQFMQRLEKGEFPIDLEEGDLQAFRSWLNDEENRAKLTKLISEHLEKLLIDSLLFYFDRHPAENVELSSGQPTMVIERATHVLRMRFKYKDSLGNEYMPVYVNIDVDDQRKNKKTNVKVPINIHWIPKQINPVPGGEECWPK